MPIHHWDSAHLEAINIAAFLVGGSSGGKFALDKKKPEIAITELSESLIATIDGAKCQKF